MTESAPETGDGGTRELPAVPQPGATAAPDPAAVAAPAATERGADVPAGNGPAAARPTQTLGIVALVLGIVALPASAAAAGLVFGVAAAIVGHQSLRREPDARGMAITGLVLGYVGIAISVVWGIALLASVLIPLFAIGIFAGIGGFGG